MLRITIAFSVLLLISGSALAQDGLSHKERQEQKAQEEEEHKARVRAALEAMQQQGEARKEEADKSNEPPFVDTRVWVPKEGCEPAVRHWLENARALRTAELEREIAFLYLLRDMLDKDVTGTDRRRLKAQTSRKVKTAMEEMEAIADPSTPVISRYRLSPTMRAGAIGWFETEATVVDFRGTSEVLCKVEDTLFVVSGLDNGQVTTNQKISIDGLFRVTGHSPWSGASAAPQVVNGIRVNPSGGVRIPRLETFALEQYAEFRDETVPNPRHPDAASQRDQERQASSQRIRMIYRQLEDSVAPDDTNSDPLEAYEAQLKKLLESQGG